MVHDSISQIFVKHYLINLALVCPTWDVVVGVVGAQTEENRQLGPAQSGVSRAGKIRQLNKESIFSYCGHFNAYLVS